MADGQSRSAESEGFGRLAIAVGVAFGMAFGVGVGLLVASIGGKSRIDTPTENKAVAEKGTTIESRPLASRPANPEWPAWKPIKQRFGPGSATASFLELLAACDEWTPSTYWSLRVNGLETETSLFSKHGHYLGQLSIHTFGDGSGLSKVQLLMDNAKLAELRLSAPTIDSELIVGWTSMAVSAGVKENAETTRLGHLVLCIPSRIPPGQMQKSLSLWLHFLPKRAQTQLLAACDAIAKNGGAEPQNIPTIGFCLGTTHVLDVVFGGDKHGSDDVLGDHWQLVISDVQCEEFSSRGSTGWPRLKESEVDNLPTLSDGEGLHNAVRRNR